MEIRQDPRSAGQGFCRLEPDCARLHASASGDGGGGDRGVYRWSCSQFVRLAGRGRCGCRSRPGGWADHIRFANRLRLARRDPGRPGRCGARSCRQSRRLAARDARRRAPLRLRSGSGRCRLTCKLAARAPGSRRGRAGASGAADPTSMGPSGRSRCLPGRLDTTWLARRRRSLDGRAGSSSLGSCRLGNQTPAWRTIQGFGTRHRRRGGTQPVGGGPTRRLARIRRDRVGQVGVLDLGNDPIHRRSSRAPPAGGGADTYDPPELH